MTNVVAVTDGVQGNISNCEIENVLVNPGRHKLLQFSQRETYQVVNKCNNTIMAEYNDVSLTILGVFLMFIGCFVLWLIKDFLEAIYGNRY